MYIVHCIIKCSYIQTQVENLNRRSHEDSAQKNPPAPWVTCEPRKRMLQNNNIWIYIYIYDYMMWFPSISMCSLVLYISLLFFVPWIFAFSHRHVWVFIVFFFVCMELFSPCNHRWRWIRFPKSWTFNQVGEIWSNFIQMVYQKNTLQICKWNTIHKNLQVEYYPQNIKSLGFQHFSRKRLPPLFGDRFPKKTRLETAGKFRSLPGRNGRNCTIQLRGHLQVPG